MYYHHKCISESYTLSSRVHSFITSSINFVAIKNRRNWFPCPNCVESYGLWVTVSLSHCVESHIWSLPIYGLWVWFPCPNCVESYGLWVTVSLSHCVESHIWSLPIYGLWIWFPCPNCVESYGLWVRFPCPTVSNPIYGLCPYMVFESGFPVPTVLNPMVFGSGFPVPLCRIPYMVFESGFPVPTVLNPMVFGLRFPCPTVSNPIYGLCPYMVFAHIWSLGLVSLSQLC